MHPRGRIIARCPTGALEFTRHDGVADLADAAEASGPASIEVAANGPLYVSGSITVQTSARGETVTASRVALCRCGHSANKPFCDGAHTETGFMAD